MSTNIKSRLYPHLAVIAVLNAVVLGLGLLFGSPLTLILNAGITASYFAVISGYAISQGYRSLSAGDPYREEGNSLVLLGVGEAGTAIVAMFSTLFVVPLGKTGDFFGYVGMLGIGAGGSACLIIGVVGLCFLAYFKVKAMVATPQPEPEHYKSKKLPNYSR